MVDSIGHRMKFGVIAPSTNTAVQPEFDSLRPWGVTNHFARIHIPDNPVRSDEDFNQLMLDIRAELMVAIDRVVTCSPGAVIMGMSMITRLPLVEISSCTRSEPGYSSMVRIASLSRWASSPL